MFLLILEREGRREGEREREGRREGGGEGETSCPDQDLNLPTLSVRYITPTKMSHLARTKSSLIYEKP